MDIQVTGEVDVTTILDSQVVAENLERNDVQQALKAVDGLGNTNCLDVGGDGIVTLVAKDDGLGLAGSDLSERRLDLGVERVLGHDDDNWHVLVDQSKGTVLELASQNTYRIVRQMYL